MSKKQQSIEVITVRLPKPLVQLLDSLVKKGIFQSRSEAIREFSRQVVLEAEDE